MERREKRGAAPFKILMINFEELEYTFPNSIELVTITTRHSMPWLVVNLYSVILSLQNSTYLEWIPRSFNSTISHLWKLPPQLLLTEKKNICIGISNLHVASFISIQKREDISLVKNVCSIFSIIFKCSESRIAFRHQKALDRVKLANKKPSRERSESLH